MNLVDGSAIVDSWNNCPPNKVNYIRAAFDTSWSLKLADLMVSVNSERGQIDRKVNREYRQQELEHATASLEYRRWAFKNGFVNNRIAF